MAVRRWSEGDLLFIRTNYDKMPYSEIAKHLGRTVAAIRNVCYEHKWTKVRAWTREEDDTLRELYGRFHEGLFLNAIANDTGRTRAAIACRANELGLCERSRPRAKESVEKRMRATSTYARTRNGLGAPTHGGLREDLGIYVRSTWEANYARYLNWLIPRGEVERWEFEPETFEFKGIKRGTRFYTPDFKVYLPDGRVEYHEVKGYLTQKGATALKRMKRYHPDKTVLLIDGPVYKEIRRKLGRMIPGWEDAPAEPRWTEEKDRRVATLWQEGVPVQEIATELGVSRNAAALRAQRQGARRPRDRSKWHHGRRKEVAT